MGEFSPAVSRPPPGGDLLGTASGRPAGCVYNPGRRMIGRSRAAQAPPLHARQQVPAVPVGAQLAAPSGCDLCPGSEIFAGFSGRRDADPYSKTYTFKHRM